MTDLRLLAVKDARRYRVNPRIFSRQISQESGFDPNARSPAGAEGVAQFMPATARGLGVNPQDPLASLDAAAKLMRSYLDKYGSYRDALVAYNAGPGAVGGPLPGETKRYVANILGGGPDPQAPGESAGAAAGGSLLKATPQNTFDQHAYQQAQRRFLVGELVARTQGTKNPLFASGLLSTAPPAPADFVKSSLAVTSTPTGHASTPAPRVSGAGGGVAAVAWARSRLGTAETAGPNRGPRIDQWEARFGLSGQPWCAIFTSLAVTKGGAPASARTPSVAVVRKQALTGRGGYQRGFVDPHHAQAGDLILFGDEHIGMVESVGRQGITMIAGNDSNRVERRTVPFGAGDIVRPKYRR